MREALLLAIGRLICTTPWFILCCVPFYTQRRVNRSTMVLVISLASIVFFLCNFFLRLQFVEFALYGSIVFLVLYIVMIRLFVWGFCVSLVKLFYVFLLVQATSTAINYTAAILLRPLYINQRISLQTTPSYAIAILLLTVLLFPFLWYFFSHQLREAMEKVRNKDFWKLCVSPILMFMITLIFNDMGTNPTIPQWQAMAIFILLTMAGLMTYYINVRLVLDTARCTRLEVDMAAMELQVALQVQNYSELTKSIEAAQAARHDVRHHLTAMTSFLEKGDTQSLSTYLNEYHQSLADETCAKLCDCYTVDVVVRHYLSLAKKTGAELDIKLVLPSNTGILDTDLTVVFGNLFENAVQSVVRQRNGQKFIRARCGIENKKLILVVDNSKEREIQYYKNNQKVMGIGQSSVKSVVEKYQGTALYEQGKTVYKVSVLMKIPAI